ncbi:MAG TPA: metallophosphoesterase [Pirellulales bacterium]|nr:metallophosphoesterase [Pirellulales bacterium]
MTEKNDHARQGAPQQNERLRPVSPFSNPLHHGHHAVDPDVQERLKQLEAQYANPTTEPLPKLASDPVWDLEHVIGDGAVKLVQDTGQLALHVVGDTGFNSYPIRNATATIEFGKANPHFEQAEESVIARMVKDCDPDDIRRGPAFLLHLGDVIYFDNTESGYASQFYEPFALCPRKIVAIPGNHDCEVHLGHQLKSLDAFVANFCMDQPGVPQAARYIHPLREMVAQPAVYWRLDAPFVQIIGLCSNVGENEGALQGGQAGTAQYTWLAQTLKQVAAEQSQLKKANKQRRALVVAVHHPPYTTGNHIGSVQMNKDLDQAFHDAGVWPDAVLAAHDHMYERFTRIKDGVEIPYCVVGGGGRYFAQQDKSGDGPPIPIPGVERACAGNGNGYGILTASPGRVRFDYYPVDNLDKNRPDSWLIDLATGKLRRP